MQLTSFTDYGLRTLMYLAAHPEGRASVKEVAEYYDISRNHLVKVVHRLAQLGHIETSKGKGGGLTLARGTRKVRLGDLITQLEPNMFTAECFNTVTNDCRITQSCQLKHYLSEATLNFIKTMNQYTLADTVHDGLFKPGKK